MEREHLIIIALILVALYMMNSSSSSDKVTAMGPANRIRYTTEEDLQRLASSGGGFGHIRTRREGYDVVEGAEGEFPQRILLGDKDYGKGHFIRNHIRHDNRNNMFSGMMGACGGGSTMMPVSIQEKFRMDTDNSGPDNMGEQHIRSLSV